MANLRRTLALAGAAAIVGPLLMGRFAVAPARAERFTRGDAQAMLNNYPPGKNIFFRLMPEPGPVLDIRPFGEFYGLNTYCEDDWHVLALTMDAPVFAPAKDECDACLVELIGFAPFSTHREASAFLGQLVPEFFLDGRQVAVERSPVKPWIDSGQVFFEEGVFVGGYGRAYYEYVKNLCGCDSRVKVYAMQFGQVIAPGSGEGRLLPAGTHDLDVTITFAPGTDEAFELFRGSTHFEVLGADAEACAP